MGAHVSLAESSAAIRGRAVHDPLLIRPHRPAAPGRHTVLDGGHTFHEEKSATLDGPLITLPDVTSD